MPLIDITNPDIIKFLVESYEKTSKLRLRWNLHHQEQLQQAATLNREEKGITELDVIRAPMEGGLAAITRDHVSSGYNRRRTPIRDTKTIPGISSMRKGHSIVDIGLGDPKDDPKLARPDTDYSLDPIMRPVDPKLTEIIYKDIPTYGREVYLWHRNHINPEDKYYYPETSYWDHGWRLKDSFFRKNQPVCGRVWKLTKGIKSRTGPHPDPGHYKDSDLPGPTKCVT